MTKEDFIQHLRSNDHVRIAYEYYKMKQEEKGKDVISYDMFVQTSGLIMKRGMLNPEQFVRYFSNKFELVFQYDPKGNLINIY